MQRLLIEEGVRRKQLFRRALRQFPRFEFPLNPAENVAKKLDMLRGEVEFFQQASSSAALRLLTSSFKPRSQLIKGYTDLNFSGYSCQREWAGLSDCSRKHVAQILHDERRELVFAQFVDLFARGLAA